MRLNTGSRRSVGSILLSPKCIENWHISTHFFRLLAILYMADTTIHVTNYRYLLFITDKENATPIKKPARNNRGRGGRKSKRSTASNNQEPNDNHGKK